MRGGTASRLDDGSDTGREIGLAGLPDRALPGPCTAPMLATPGGMPAHPEHFGFEVKWDGYRALARFDGRRLRLCSRNGLDLSPRFPEVVAMREALHRPVLLDGELVALDRDGHPSFSALQTRMPHPGDPRGARRSWDPHLHSLHYMVFDILHYARKPVARLPYADRRSLLESLALAGPAWQTPPCHGDGVALLEVMRRNRQEGVIAKRYTSTYQPGRRSGDWIKIRVSRSDEFVVVGWASGRHGMSSLLLGYHASAADAAAGVPLVYCGKVGTGFSGSDRARLERVLRRLVVATPPVTGDLPHGPGVSWCRPALVAQIRYSERTPDGALRHPLFLGLRGDKLPEEVVHRPGMAS